MSSEWQVQRLDLIAEINPTRKVRKGSDVPFVDMAALPQLSRDISLDGVVNRVAKGAGAHFQNGDTLLARITPCLENGKTAQVRCLDDGSIAEGSTEFIVLCGKDPADNDFIYYLCRDPVFREYAIGRMEGTSGRQRVSWQSIAAYEFSLPPADERRSAARVLSALDDRITLLRETNTTLEAIAQALFKSWFVDFDPVHAKMQGRAPEGMIEATAALFPDSFEESELGAVPKGWKWVPLNAAYEINPTRKLKKGEIAPYLDMAGVHTQGHSVSGVVQRQMGSGTKFINGDTLLARITPCLENGKTAFVDFLSADTTGWGSTEFVVLRPKDPLPPYHAYLLARLPAFREHAIRSMSGTSGRQRIQNDVHSQFLVAVPNEPVAKAFSELVTVIQKSIREGHQQAETLSALRDTLLARLITGRVNLKTETTNKPEES